MCQSTPATSNVEDAHRRIRRIVWYLQLVYQQLDLVLLCLFQGAGYGRPITAHVANKKLRNFAPTT
jgi:hypothetical protein